MKVRGYAQPPAQLQRQRARRHADPLDPRQHGVVPRLDGKVALITGAGNGIGREAALLFASEGAKVVVADAVPDRGHGTVDAIRAAHGDAAFVQVDVSNASQVAAMVRFATDTYGALHVLYNNAGIFPADDGGVTETPESTWDRVMAVNLKGVWLGCRHGIPALLASGGGAIVNVASFVALMGAATAQVAYTASKGGVLAFTRELAVEYAREGIRANALCPGPIDTPMLAELMSDPERRQRRMVHIPMGRLGRPEELAQAALFLASDESSFMTGAALVVDGGITAAYVTPE
jgi:NAD(P)-dependent dehydrogenase (short-subunit alcohol dehydrogenase family)